MLGYKGLNFLPVFLQDVLKTVNALSEDANQQVSTGRFHKQVQLNVQFQ